MKDINIVAGIEAEILPKHVGGPRTDFTGTLINERMEFLNAYGYGKDNSTNPKDQKDHILASQLGGSNDTDNLVPQSRLINQNLGLWNKGEAWYDKENYIAEWLQNNQLSDQVVEWKVAINYDLSQSRRPIGFRLEANLYAIKKVCGSQTNKLRKVETKEKIRSYYPNHIECNTNNFGNI